MIRLMLVDDHEIVRTGLKTFLETQPGFVVVAEAGNGPEAVQIGLEERPDIILMDIAMPGGDGLEATRALKTAWPEVLILALTVYEDKYYFMEMLAAGASGYLTKQAAATELVQAIHSVSRGHIYLQPSLARWLLEDYQRLAERSEKHSTNESTTADMVALNVLSERERQVLELLARGMNNPEIGAQLGLSPKTIARHRERIMGKLNLHSRTGLVRYAIHTGLIDTD